MKNLKISLRPRNIVMMSGYKTDKTIKKKKK